MNRNNILAENLRDAFSKYAENDAVSHGGNTYSYAAFTQSSLSISHCIPDATGDPDPVAILGKKGLFTYAGICGSLFASRAYMPLNLKFPTARNKKMLELSGTQIIVADVNAIEMLDHLLADAMQTFTIILEEESPELTAKYQQHQFLCPDKDAKPVSREISSTKEDIAYLLFTSGSTGVPKGVPVSNLNVTSYLQHVLENWDFRESDRFSQTFDLTFDLSVHDMMVCWLSGACLCIPEDDSALNTASYIRDQKITSWFSVPSMAMLMNKMRLLKENAFEKVRLSFFCGEPLPADICEKWSKATGGKEVVNLYGPSEATIAISAYTWDESHQKSLNGIISIGKMFTTQQYCLLDVAKMQQDTQKGELCLGGSQIIKEYLNDPALSEKYFIEIPGQEGSIWYRTGDLAELDGEGDLFFLGRTDSEVKISGFRVNLYEIDGLIRKITGAQQVATLLDEPGSQLKTFVSNDGSMDDSEIIRKCREELPWYMIPEVIIFVEELPLNPNGKVDRKRLKQMLHEQD